VASPRPKRDSDGRFVKKSAATSKGGRRPGVGQLALLTPAIILGLIGFLVPVCWVGSLVLMGILWGALAVTRQQTSGGRGVLSEVVDVVVDEARDAADAATQNKRTPDPSDSTG
jgi:hypothetical protein